MLDFPLAPVVGEKYPPTPVDGVNTYTWDGEKWTITHNAPPGMATPLMDGVADPGDSDAYSREDHVHPSDPTLATGAYVDAELAKKLAISGGAMTGFLTLHADPDADMRAATKKYADAKIAAEVTRANAAYQAKDAQLFAGIPTAHSNNYTTVAADAQRCVAGTGTFYLNSPLYPVGTVITFAGYTGGMTLVCSGATIYWISPTGLTSGNRYIPDRGIATVLKTPDGNWIIGGTGIT